MTEIMTVKEVAEYLKLTEYTVYKWAKKGQLPCLRLGNKTIRFSKEDIQNWVRNA